MDRFIIDYKESIEFCEDYCNLMQQYCDKEIFNECIHFLDLAFPKWKTNEGLGYRAAEFLLHIIEHSESMLNGKFKKEDLTVLYLEINDTYPQFFRNFQTDFELYALDKFNLIYCDFDDVETSEKDYEVQLNQFTAAIKKSVHYNFF